MRSWFGLVNQVCYAYSLTDELNPLREMLKPKNILYWYEQMQTIFERSKKKIVDIKNGVQIFDRLKKKLVWLQISQK